METQWIPLKGYEDLYEVRNGVVRGKARTVRIGANLRHVKSKIMRVFRSNGNPAVKLSRRGEARTVYVSDVLRWESQSRQERLRNEGDSPSPTTE